MNNSTPTLPPREPVTLQYGLNNVPVELSKRVFGARILVVDDEPEIVRALWARLTFAGYEVISAYDGFSAITAATKCYPDLIILDIGLPGEDGFIIARRLTELLPVAVPVIFLSARTGLTNRAEALDVGAVDYIIKPFTGDRVLAARRGTCPATLRQS